MTAYALKPLVPSRRPSRANCANGTQKKERGPVQKVAVTPPFLNSAGMGGGVPSAHAGHTASQLALR